MGLGSDRCPVTPPFASGSRFRGLSLSSRTEDGGYEVGRGEARRGEARLQASRFKLQGRTDWELGGRDAGTLDGATGAGDDGGRGLPPYSGATNVRHSEDSALCAHYAQILVTKSLTHHTTC